MGEIAKALGTPVEFQYKEQTYKLSPWTYDIMGKYEAYLQDVAMRNVKRMAKYLTDEQFALLASKTRKDIDVGTYTFGQTEVWQSFNSYIHYAYLTQLCLLDNHPGIQYEFVREMVKDIGDVVSEKMSEANTDPNPKTQPAS